MATPTLQPQFNQKTQTILSGVTLGFRLLPFFITGIETLLGKKTGQTKKDAVTGLFNATAIGVAGGFGLAGDPQVSQAIQVLQPTVSAAIDAMAAHFFPNDPVASAQVSG